MLLWFAGLSFVIVWAVFKSPTVDYRLVMLGSALPVGEVILGGPRVLHTLMAGGALLFLLMIATRGRRLAQRRWVGLAIGLLLHLALDGIWARQQVFWWPFFGLDFGAGGLPELERPLVVIALQEAVGGLCLVWAWRRFQLDDADRRASFLRTGHLGRDLVG